MRLQAPNPSPRKAPHSSPALPSPVLTRLRKRGWLCWTGVGLTCLLAACWMTQWRVFAPSWVHRMFPPGWAARCRIGGGSILIWWEWTDPVEFERLMNYGWGLAFDPRWERNSANKTVWLPRANLGVKGSEVELPFWCLGVPAAVASLCMVRRLGRRSTAWAPHARRIAATTAGFATAAIILSVSPGDRSNLPPLITIADRTWAFVVHDEGLGLVGESTSNAPGLPRARSLKLALVRPRSFSYGQFILRDFRWTVESAGPSWAFVGRLLPENSLCAGLSWEVLVVLIGLPTLIGCWRSRTVFRPDSACLACGYDLTGQPTPGCPECGAGRAHSSPVADGGAGRGSGGVSRPEGAVE